jgi:hypothetical protein
LLKSRHNLLGTSLRPARLHSCPAGAYTCLSHPVGWKSHLNAETVLCCLQPRVGVDTHCTPPGLFWGQTSHSWNLGTSQVRRCASVAPEAAYWCPPQRRNHLEARWPVLPLSTASVRTSSLLNFPEVVLSGSVGQNWCLRAIC